jgi:hypothetical protein
MFGRWRPVDATRIRNMVVLNAFRVTMQVLGETPVSPRIIIPREYGRRNFGPRFFLSRW